MFQEVPDKSKMILYIVTVMLIIFSRRATCGHREVIVLEGEKAQLNFPYLCDSTRVTLRDTNRPEFYSSAYPKFISLPANQNLTNQNESQSDQCSVSLTMNPALKSDEGGYILTAYKNGIMLPDDERIKLVVDYPPGKVSCTASNDYSDGEWVSLHCKAPVGSVSGQIICYQDRTKLSNSTQPEESGDTLNQVIMSRLEGLVYCCSSTVDQSKEMCQCKDCCWDPVQNTALTNFPDPCPVSLSTLYPTLLQNSTDPTLSSNSQTDELTEKPSTKKRDFNISLYWQYIIIGMLILLIIIFAILYIWKIKVKNLASKTIDAMKNQSELEMINGE